MGQVISNIIFRDIIFLNIFIMSDTYAKKLTYPISNGFFMIVSKTFYIMYLPDLKLPTLL